MASLCYIPANAFGLSHLNAFMSSWNNQLFLLCVLEYGPTTSIKFQTRGEAIYIHVSA